MIRVLRTVWHRYLDEEVSTLAAGIGLFALLSLPPALVAIAAIYGLVTPRADVWAHLAWVGRFLPTSVTGLLHLLLERIVASSPERLSAAAAGSVLLSVIGARGAVAAAMGALNKIARLEEHRTFLRRQGVALLLTVMGIAIGTCVLVSVVAVPSVASVAEWHGDAWNLYTELRWPAAFVVATGYLALFYRLAPASGTSWRGALIGAATAAALWVLASVGLSWWVEGFSDYEAMYGAAGSMLIVLLWFYLSALAMLLGGIVAAEVKAGARRKAEVRGAAAEQTA